MIQLTPKWTNFQKISFRFIFAYFFLSIAPFLLYYIPYTKFLTDFYSKIRREFVVWVAEHILDLGVLTIFPGGSGDTTFNYAQIFTFFVVSILVCIIWSILDRKRESYQTFLRYFRIYVSYYVAAIMLSYGLSKVFYLQFSAPPLIRLLQPFGEASPMGIAWTFMGASKTYTMFSGFAEILGATLLFYRRTRTLGALVVVGVMLNVFMMNMSYDIPVKLYSFHLMMMAFFVGTLDYQRIVNLIALKTPMKVTNSMGAYFKNRKVSIGMTILKLAFIGYTLFLYIDGNLDYSKQKYGSPKPLLYGIYDATTFVINNDTLPPLLTDEIRWKKLICDSNFSNRIIIKGMDDKNTWYKYTIDSLKNNIEMIATRDSTDIYNLHYVKKDSVLFLKGTWKKDSIEIKMDEFDLNKFYLINRDFHWINEYPNNR
tara:strand:- start:852 stop:2132 length:1281 start_codon:yes stop_codon:yes gene_type:complete